MFTIEMTDEQVDAIIIKELQECYERNLATAVDKHEGRYCHPEDYKASLEAMSACCVILKGYMVASDYEKWSADKETCNEL